MVRSWTPTAARDGVGLGTTTRVIVTRPEIVEPASSLLALRVTQLDQAASRFRSDSDLALANRCAGRPVRVGALLGNAVRISLAMAAATDGTVDPTVGDGVVEAGYDRTFELLPATFDPLVMPPETFTVEVPTGPRPTWRDVVVTSSPGHTFLTVPVGSTLDLGAVAKAWLADLVAAEIASRWDCGALVDLGGDIAVAGPAPDDDWVVGLPAPPARSARRVADAVAVSVGGIATSGQDRRRWQTADGPAHHIIDPATRLPAATPWRAVTAHAATCAEANAAATTAMVLGYDAPGWLVQRGIAARLLSLDGSAPTVVGPWPEPDLQSDTEEGSHGQS